MSAGRSRIFAILLLLAAQASAECIRVEGSPDAWIVRIEIESCVVVEEEVERRLGTSDIDWLRAHLSRIAEHNPGVVLTGRQVDRMGVEQTGEADFLLRGSVEGLEGAETESWFLSDDRPRACERWSAGTTVQLYRTTTCCDVLPPPDIPCSLGIGRLQPIPPALAALANVSTSQP